jgi:gamma-glutamyltranspeptidase/glutathione hydrolase
MVTQPRFHHQYLPDRIALEPDALSEGVRAELTLKGHSLQPLERGYGNMQVVIWDRVRGEVSAASDPRGIGLGRVR